MRVSPIGSEGEKKYCLLGIAFCSSAHEQILQKAIRIVACGEVPVNHAKQAAAMWSRRTLRRSRLPDSLSRMTSSSALETMVSPSVLGLHVLLHIHHLRLVLHTLAVHHLHVRIRWIVW
jgi:hypothetical protein